MKKHFKKRLAAFKVGLVLSIMITPFCFYKLSETVSALTNVITYNQYGSFTRTNTPLVISGSTNFGLSTLDGNLQGKYSGSLTINYSITSGLSISNFSVITEDCWITYYDSSSMNIQFNDVSHFSVSFQRTSGSTSLNDIFNSITINSLTNWDMHMITYGDNYMQQHIYDSVDGLEAAMSTTNSTLSRCETLLTSISQNGGSGGSSTVNNIDINVDHIADDLNLLKTSSDSILDELVGFLTDSIGHIITMENLIDAIESTTTALNGISSQLTSMATTLNSISSTLNNINTAVQNIDNSIDTISWKSNGLINLGVSVGGGIYSQDSITTPTSYLFLKLRNTVDKPSSIYKINTGVYNNYRNVAINNLYINTITNNINENINFKYYVDTSSMYLTIYIYNTYFGTNNDSRWFIFDIKTSKYQMLYDNTQFSAEYITSDDIEYWTLLDYFDQYDINRQMLSALQQLSINVHGDIIQQTEEVINNYDTSFNSIHNIESSFVNNFDTINPGVVSMLNSNLQIPNGFIEGSNFIKTLFPKVVDNSSLVGFPYFLILAIAVLIVLLG